MTPKHPFITYTVRYNTETRLFSLWDNEERFVAEDVNGRELGRDAWRRGAEAVKYDYDLTKDETIPLKYGRD